MDAALKDLPGVQAPRVPPHCEHVYYQYCVYTPDRDSVVTRCIRHGVDLETLHVDLCSRLPLFGDLQTSAPGAERAEQAIQVPVYASLNDEKMRRIATTVRRALSRNGSS
jgi:dTDP-4-amino-4,6-dideoxygalactose transaminase